MLSRSTLFNSPIKNAPRLALPFFILLAALFHLSTIYLFKIVYAPSHLSKPVPAQVFFLAPNSPSSQQISCWLKSNDPSIFSPLKTIQAARLPIPSSIYDPKPASPALRPLPISQKDLAADLLPPTDQAALPSFVSPNTTAIPAASIKPIQQKTTIQLSDPLSARIAGALGTPLLPSEATLPLPPTKLTLNIDAEGIPRHVIVSQSCGNAAADEVASRWAMTLSFTKTDHETWGTLLVIWGNIATR
ncbi:MAG: hypothetical protein FJ390_01435 [Verrucomicrobia bacterium]|nr:hypothetical protein [Verrucomicrobiota bacterium]